MVHNFLKYIKIKNFVPSKTEKKHKFLNALVSDKPSISHKY